MNHRQAQDPRLPLGRPFKDRTAIGRHIAKIFRGGELDAKSNVQKMHIPFSDKPIAFYSLDVVLAVGYKAENRRAVEFRTLSPVEQAYIA